MKFFFPFTLLFLFFFTSCSKKIKPASTETEINYIFPDDWLGIWTGTLDIYSNGKKTMSVPMEAINQRTDTAGIYKWMLVYGSGEKQDKRPYILRTIDKNKGIYEVDELNSIKLSGHHYLNKYISTFEVEGSILTSVYELVSDKMIFEIYFNDKKNPSKTGGDTLNQIPSVLSYPTKVFQRAILTKKK